MRHLILSAILGLCPCTALAQSPSISVEDLKAQIDAQVSGSSGYRELLNDPDPARSMAAIQIMLTSGDDVLKRMALQAGLLAADPSVRRATAEAYMASEPSLIVHLDGKDIESKFFAETVTGGWLKGALGPNKQGAVVLSLGGYNEELGCYTLKPRNKYCGVAVGSGDFFVSVSDTMSGAFSLSETGTLTGFAKITNVTEAIPATIKLLE